MRFARKILSQEQCRQAELLAVQAGISNDQLMEAAGRALANQVIERRPKGRIFVFCGPGNNGGDGYVAARHLQDKGYAPQVYSYGDSKKLQGEARTAFSQWTESTHSLQEFRSATARDIIVDALFGTGLSRPVPETIVESFKRAAPACLIAADLPSGVHGDTGEIMGFAPKADLTVSFVSQSPAAFLLPGALYCGEVREVDIGIPESVASQIVPTMWTLDAGSAAALYPWPDQSTHKHRRGRLWVVSGDQYSTGAARLAAWAGQRAGAGWVSLVTSKKAARVCAAHETSILITVPPDPQAIASMGKPEDCWVIGPGTGLTPKTRQLTLDLLKRPGPRLLDADALSVFAETPDLLFAALSDAHVLTPHAGEFRRLFPDLASIDPVAQARAAAQRSGAIIILKGPDTIIASPDGSIVFNGLAPAWLASAGTGDVLAGLIAGLMAQNMASFEAAALGVWLHSEAARQAGAGLIAEDLVESVPLVLRNLSSHEISSPR